MKLMKTLRTLVFLTVLALIYVYMQMEIINLAYQGKKRQRQIVELSESNGVLAYSILKLKSSNHLGENLLSENSSLRFQDNDNVVKLVTQDHLPMDEIQATSIDQKNNNPILNFFLFKAPVEARAEEKTDSFKPWRRAH